MFDFLEKVLDILKDLLPDKNQPNQVWISRIIILMLAFIGAFYLFFINIKDTDLGKKIGFNANKNLTVQMPTLSEFAITHTSVLELLSNFKDSSNGLVSNIFLVALYNRPANDFIISDPSLNKDLLIFAWSVPVEKFSNLENMRQAINTDKELIFNDAWNSNKDSINNCYTQEIPNKFKQRLQKIFEKEKSTHYSICKIYDRSQKIVIAFTLNFFHFSSGTLNEREIIEYKQREITIEASRRFSRYTIPYIQNSLF